MADKVDAQLNACLERPERQSTAGMASCMVAAGAAYDTQLNEMYQQVIAALDPASRDLLRAAQRQWLAFRRAEEAAQAGPWREGRGTIAQLAVQSAALTAMKQRIDELRLYLP